MRLSDFFAKIFLFWGIADERRARNRPCGRRTLLYVPMAHLSALSTRL